jgi:ribosomal protein L40E
MDENHEPDEDATRTTGTSEQGMKPCLYCGSMIPMAASICATCKYNQSRWKNNVTFFGGLTGLVTLALPAFTFLWSASINNIERMNWAKKVEVRYFRTEIVPEFDAVFSNSGNEPAFVDEIAVYYRGGYIRYRVNRQVEPKQFLSVETINKNPKKEYSTFIARDFLRTSSGRVTPFILSNTDFAMKNSTNPKCFTPVFFLENEADIQRITASSNSGVLVQEPAEAHVIYYGPATGDKIEAKFAAVATFASRVVTHDRARLGSWRAAIRHLTYRGGVSARLSLV